LRRQLEPDRAEAHAFYCSARWRRLRSAFLADNPLCVECLKSERLTPATIAHHRVERLAAPRRALDPTNLEALCNPCHTRLHKGTERNGESL
jgi:5-methylcytosine-specific restriction protein A